MNHRSNALAIAVLLLSGFGAGSAAAQRPDREQRCGWFDNPTPGNAWLHDRDGEWTVAIQADHQAKGDWPPKYRHGQWQRTGAGGHGYGCACLTVRVDAAEKNILEIFSSEARPLSTCRKDRALEGVEERLRQDPPDDR